MSQKKVFYHPYSKSKAIRTSLGQITLDYEGKASVTDEQYDVLMQIPAFRTHQEYVANKGSKPAAAFMPEPETHLKLVPMKFKRAGQTITTGDGTFIADDNCIAMVPEGAVFSLERAGYTMVDMSDEDMEYNRKKLAEEKQIEKQRKADEFQKQKEEEKRKKEEAIARKKETERLKAETAAQHKHGAPAPEAPAAAEQPEVKKPATLLKEDLVDMEPQDLQAMGKVRGVEFPADATPEQMIELLLASNPMPE